MDWEWDRMRIGIVTETRMDLGAKKADHPTAIKGVTKSNGNWI
jgi:hypothetical protein